MTRKRTCATKLRERCCGDIRASLHYSRVDSHVYRSNRQTKMLHSSRRMSFSFSAKDETRGLDSRVVLPRRARSLISQPWLPTPPRTSSNGHLWVALSITRVSKGCVRPSSTPGCRATFYTYP